MKNKLIAAVLICVTFVTCVYFYLIYSVPYSEIDHLVNGYVNIEVKSDGKAPYKIQTLKPSDWVGYHKISKSLKDAIVISEDWSFFEHSGVDFGQIKKSIDSKLNKNKKLRGASTISQQLVKNLFYSNKRSYWRKAKEYFTVRYLEKTLTKKKILESYFNIIEYGPKIYGIKQATKYYFKKSPKNINAKEGAFIAMLLPSPKKNGQSFRERKLTTFGKQSVSIILNKMHKAKMINKSTLQNELRRKLNWEGKTSTTNERELKLKRAKSTFILSKKIKKRSKNKSKKTNYEKKYRQDIEIDVDDNPHFDDDALKENIGGIKEEFSL